MKIDIASDLHLETWPDHDRPFDFSKDRDLLILAGDVLPYHIRGDTDFLDIQCAWSPVVYVLGNHEFYGSPSHQECAAHWKDYASSNPNLHVLDRDVVEVGGVRIAGCTLYSAVPPHLQMSYMHAINDFRGHHTVNDHIAYHERDAAWLGTVDAVDIVVTHFPPSRLCQHPDFDGDPFNDYFYADCDGLVESLNPRVWVAGHTHRAWDFVHPSGVRMVGKPFGYMHENRQRLPYVLDLDLG